MDPYAHEGQTNPTLAVYSHAMLVTNDSKEFRRHMPPLYLSQRHCLVYREEIIQVSLQSKFLILCLGTSSFIVLSYKRWRMGRNLRSIENSYYQLQCIPIHLRFLSFLPQYQAPTLWHPNYLVLQKLSGQQKALGSFQPALCFRVFSQKSVSLAFAARLFLCTMYLYVSPYKCTSYQNIWSPKETAAIISSLEEDPSDFRNQHGNSFSNPASWHSI